MTGRQSPALFEKPSSSQRRAALPGSRVEDGYPRRYLAARAQLSPKVRRYLREAQRDRGETEVAEVARVGLLDARGEHVGASIRLTVEAATPASNHREARVSVALPHSTRSSRLNGMAGNMPSGNVGSAAPRG